MKDLIDVLADGLVRCPERFTKMPEECLHWIRIVGIELAKAEARKCYEEENKKTVLCSLKLSSPKKSDAASETAARASDAYQQYLAEYEQVVLVERHYKHMMSWLMQKLDAWRTKCANNRGEIKAYQS